MHPPASDDGRGRLASPRWRGAHAAGRPALRLRSRAARARRPAAPLTSSSSSGARRAEHQRSHRVGDARMRQRVQPPQRDVGELARLQRADLRLPAEDPRAAAVVAISSARRTVSACGPPAPWPSARPAGPRPAASWPRWRPRRPRRARPATPASSRSCDRQMPAPSRAFEDGQCATPVPVPASLAMRSVIEVDGVGEPDVVAEPAQRVQVLHRRAAEALGAVVVLVGGLGQVGVQPHARSGGPARPRR